MKPFEKRDLPGFYDEWIKYAESDLKLARLAQDNGEVLPAQICFHTQQSVEKALKAVLIVCGIDFPLTHDIEVLLELADQNRIELPPELANAGLLTPYAVETRYPGLWEEISEADVGEAIALAKNAVHWAKAFPHGESS